MIKPHENPYGYKKLLVYQKAEDLQSECRKLTGFFPRQKTLIDLADQMDRSARSGKQNIVEGWKRNTTKEYFDFLGFSIGAIAELEEDCDDIWKGRYPEVMGRRGVMGEMGEKGGMGEMNKVGEMGEKGGMRERGKPIPFSPFKPFYPSFDSNNPANLTNPLKPFTSPCPPFDIDKLSFYPLDKSLPPIVQLKLRCKELNFLLHKLQKSLEQKMLDEKTLSANDRARMNLQKEKLQSLDYEQFLEENGMKKLEDGKIVSKFKN